MYSCCMPDDEVVTNNYYGDYEPVFVSRDAIDTTIKLLSPKEIVNSGKIYVLNDLLFVGEGRKGFHIIDNSTPSNPQIIKFLQVLGATDVAIRNDVLYINQAVDLVTLRFHQQNESIEILKRNKNIFPEMSSPQGYSIYVPQDSIVVGWNQISI